jgi:hypothetical protein
MHVELHTDTHRLGTRFRALARVAKLQYYSTSSSFPSYQLARSKIRPRPRPPPFYLQQNKKINILSCPVLSCPISFNANPNPNPNPTLHKQHYHTTPYIATQPEIKIRTLLLLPLLPAIPTTKYSRRTTVLYTVFPLSTYPVFPFPIPFPLPFPFPFQRS